MGTRKSAESPSSPKATSPTGSCPRRRLSTAPARAYSARPARPTTEPTAFRAVASPCPAALDRRQRAPGAPLSPMQSAAASSSESGDGISTISVQIQAGGLTHHPSRRLTNSSIEEREGGKKQKGRQSA